MRGMGSIVKRGNVWWIRYSFRGRRVAESSKSSDRAVAINLLKQRHAEMAAGRGLHVDTEQVTFDQLVELIETDYRVNHRRSAPTMRGALAHLRDAFGTTPPVGITYHSLQRYIDARTKDGARPATIQYELRILSRMFSLAIPDLLHQRPKFPSLRLNNTRAGFFEDDQLVAVLAQLPPWLRPAIHFAALTGWRIGEVCGLVWKNVDLTAGTVRLDPGTTKNDEGRLFPFGASPALEALMREQHDLTRALERQTGRIIPHVFHHDGRQLKWFRKTWQRACRDAGCPDRLVHDLRRTAVRNLERAGIARSVAMKLTGHLTEAVYRRYAIVSEQDLAAAVRKVAAEGR